MRGLLEALTRRYPIIVSFRVDASAGARYLVYMTNTTTTATMTTEAADLLERVCDAGENGLADLVAYRSAACRELAIGTRAYITLREGRMYATGLGIMASIHNLTRRAFNAVRA